MAGGYMPLKMKRKELDDVNDDFSDFSLSSPARKIPRLDGELPPIMEEEDPEVPLVFEDSMAERDLSDIAEGVGGPVVEELPVNDERAIVLFKQPANNGPLLQSPSNFSVHLGSDILSGLKNQVFWSNQHNPVIRSAEDEAPGREKQNNAATEKSWAVIPWVPSQFPPTQNEDLMETEEMEIEDNNIGVVEHKQGDEYRRASVSGGLQHQWQEQQCVVPQFPPQNTNSPAAWHR